MKNLIAKILPLFILIISTANLHGQESDPGLLSIDRLFNSNEFRQEWLGQTEWFDNGESYTKIEPAIDNKGMEIAVYETKTGKKRTLVSAKHLTPKGRERALRIASYSWSEDQKKLLIFTNTKRVWRTNTKGDYWYLNLDTEELKQLGRGLPESSLMFTKFSPDNEFVSYVSEFNIYTENLKTGKIGQLTKDGNKDIINGTFDWVYEEELFCKDGFRWSPDGKQIAFWQLDASEIKNFSMINNTDSIYSKVIPVQYPKVGEDPSSCRLGSINIGTGKITWMNIPGDPKQNYIPRMQWVAQQILVQQLNRKQNQLNVYLCNPSTGECKLSYTESDDAWVDIMNLDATANWTMYDMEIVDREESFLRVTEKDGWRHVYKINLDGSGEINLTNFDADIARFYGLDNKRKNLYINASPKNATQRYLYKIANSGKGKLQKLTPEKYQGVNQYNISPNGKYAIHRFSSSNTPPITDLVSLPDHKVIRHLVENKTYKEKIATLKLPKTEYFKITTKDNVEMDVKITKPLDFDASKKYPVLFHVYGEPAGQTTTDRWQLGWHHLLVQKGYVVITTDNRGTPCPKGRKWRKSIYRKVGIINSRDQAMAANEILKLDYLDADRVAVWGWSGGGSMTLNLMFRYPEIYKTGISVAFVSNQLYYDNIYQERYMGLPSENMEDFVKGSPITYAKNLKGNLLLVHGTGDDNVHYQNAEALINELIKHNKQFQVMPYPNRSHGIYEGENTRRHLYTLFTNYLTKHVTPGAQ